MSKPASTRYLVWARSGGGRILALDCKCGVVTVNLTPGSRHYRCPGCHVTYEPPRDRVVQR